MPLKLKKIAVIIVEIAILAAIFWAITAYQQRNLLPTDRMFAPALIAPTIEGKTYDLKAHSGRPTLIYFFAPWCPFCSASADNVVRLRRWRDEASLNILVVALDWENKQQIEEYIQKHELNVPVVLGDSAIAQDWNVYGFPTYYVLDKDHQIVRRDFGYSTQLGLLWRSLTAR